MRTCFSDFSTDHLTDKPCQEYQRNCILFADTWHIPAGNVACRIDLPPGSISHTPRCTLLPANGYFLNLVHKALPVDDTSPHNQGLRKYFYTSFQCLRNENTPLQTRRIMQHNWLVNRKCFFSRLSLAEFVNQVRRFATHVAASFG